VQTCSKCHALSPDSASLCSKCGEELSVWSETAVALRELQENPRVIYIRISVAQDCCPACRQIEGAYDKATTPVLPVEGCSHAHGCRCFYQPVLEVIYP
jgi:RNA polymerase subunit RPABC4/transcription elongation factor Spt4